MDNSVVGTLHHEWRQARFVPKTTKLQIWCTPMVLSKAMEGYLSELNPAQRTAVMQITGPLLVVAGAGAGKTKTIAFRILHLVKQGIPPEQILAITFTNKAAGEMRDRVRALLGKDEQSASHANRTGRQPTPFVSTFHALGVRLLREHATEANLSKSFTIYDRNDSKQAVKTSLDALGIDPKRYEPARILSEISRAKGDFKTPSDYQKSIRSGFGEIVARVWPRYEEELRKEKALDFDDLLVKTALLLRDNEAVRTHLQKRWSYIHIDEYQDTNKVQYEIARILGVAHRNICVVGDSDQSIYGWRGADIANILNFEKDYPDAVVVLLEQNYRSTKTILAAASSVIIKNKIRKDKRLFTENPDGEKIGLYTAYDEEDEARFVAKRAAAYIARGTKPEDIAVLYRANFQSRALEQAFLSENVHYQLVGTRFFERKEVKDALTYMRVALDGERGSDLRRVLNMPARGLGKVALLTIIEGKESELAPTAKRRFAEFRGIIERIKASAEKDKASDAVKIVLHESGLGALYTNGKGEDAERLENLKELVTVASAYDHLPAPEGIRQLLEDAALASDQDELTEDKSGVKLMTVHAAKGLEFDLVFVTGLEEGLFPHDGGGTANEERMEEERRLAYVAITRAKKKLILTYAGMRTIFGLRNATVPSQFLQDIEDTYLEAEEGDGSAFRTIYL
jgi:DNA helicase-2/ATP-dependent DNA helicase PcrA